MYDELKLLAGSARLAFAIVYVRKMNYAFHVLPAYSSQKYRIYRNLQILLNKIFEVTGKLI